MSDIKPFRSERLQCGCCGSSFNTWPEYTDQDQDKGFGICRSCQEDIRYHDWWEWQTTINLVRDSLNFWNRFTFEHMPRRQQIKICLRLMERKIIGYKIEKSHAINV